MVYQLSYHLFEGDLPKSRSSESNILAASECLVIESLAQMREEVMHVEGEKIVDEILGDSQPVFDQTPEIGAYPSSDSTDTDEDNLPLKWSVQRIMVLVSIKGKEKVTEETPRRRPFTRAVTQKLMGDAMKSNEKIEGRENLVR
ncbi:hypothetical protein KY290_036429 [Solanum tuberosum]|uniref:Uncharacterized protein n=1 Tax=Solanum tuberosum TaxID=4113 RepID=A0ABQ7TSL9_SOLTU|nr:hypothetical protein KY284_037598 [Solanum tuberosum]KAH0636037.1 hypothetical protein KY289_035952 [Solanum tuberosum]KAH0639153.1 hypothetical protein KY285_035739 [Solanum tuberosum]KAH0737724.1 hypothetical protein KY290_036429 [Solanum tuberosum]